MSMLPGEDPRFRTTDGLIYRHSPKQPKEVFKPIVIELTAADIATAVLVPGFVLGCRSADGVFVRCVATATDGSQTPAAILHRVVDLTDPITGAVAYSAGDKIKAAAKVLGWVAPNGLTLDSSWGATPPLAFKAAEVALRFAGFLAAPPAVFSSKESGDALACTVVTGAILNLTGDGGTMITYQGGDVVYLEPAIARHAVRMGLATCAAITDQVAYAAM